MMRIIKSRLPKTGDHSLIFESSIGSEVAQKVTTVTFSGIFWAIWLSLWLPLFTYLFWILAPIWGVDAISDNHDESLPVLILLTTVGFALGALLVLGGVVQWAFGSTRPRAKDIPSITVKKLAKKHGLEESELAASWQARRLVIHHNPDNSISKIELDE